MVYLQLSETNEVKATVNNFEKLPIEVQNKIKKPHSAIVEEIPTVEVPEGKYVVWYYENGEFRYELLDVIESSDTYALEEVFK